MRFTRDQLFGLKMGALASIESGNGKQGDQNTVDLCSDLLLLHDAASEYFRIGAREPFDHGDHADFVRARQNLQDALKHTPIHAPAHPEAPLCEICGRPMARQVMEPNIEYCAGHTVSPAKPRCTEPGCVDGFIMAWKPNDLNPIAPTPWPCPRCNSGKQAGEGER